MEVGVGELTVAVEKTTFDVGATVGVASIEQDVNKTASQGNTFFMAGIIASQG